MGGYSDIYIHTQAQVIFYGFTILNFKNFGVFRKINICLGMKILWNIFWGRHKIGLYLGVISMHLGSFLKVKVHNGDIFGGC